MTENRLYALLTAGALITGLLLVAAPDNGVKAAGIPSPATLTAVASTVTVSTGDAAEVPTGGSVPDVDGTIPGELRYSAPATTAPPEVLAAGASGSSSGDSSGTPPTTQPASPTTTAAPATTTTSSPGTTTTTAVQSGYRDDYAAQFVSSINGLRSSSGLPALRRSGTLDSAARAWAKDMGEKGKLEHHAITSLMPPFLLVGENLGTGGTVSSVFSALAASGAHRANMLGDWTHVGVGVWQDTSGKIWTVHLFGLAG